MGWAASVFYEVERIGPPLPPGPVLVVANHTNALLDPLVLFHTAGRPTRPLAKAPLFDHPFVGTFLKGVGGLPVYRRQDDPARMHLNERTFDAAVRSLQAGEAVQIYPEGQSHSEPSLTPLRTGAARIALQAEAQAGWRLGLRVVPVGLTYHRRQLFRGKAAAFVGEGIEAAGWQERYEVDPVAAVQELTDLLAERLRAVTLNFAATEERELVDAAEGLWAREKGKTGWTERPTLAARLPRLQAFAQGLAWLRATDPERYAHLGRAVARYRRLTGLLGVQEGEVPPAYRPGAVLRYAARRTATVLLLTPPALAAFVFWAVPYRVPALVVRAVDPAPDSVSTYKLSAAFLAFPLAWAVWVVLAWSLGGALPASAVAVVAPLAGLAWTRWREELGAGAEDVAAFLRVAGRPRRLERVRQLRLELVAAFDRVAEEMAGAPGPDGGTGDPAGGGDRPAAAGGRGEDAARVEP